MIRNLLPAATICLLILTATFAVGADRPNIILCMADDQGWGDVGYQDHPVLLTPHLDAMAADGLQFDRFYAAAPVCSPTRASVLTGRTPNRMGCFQWGHTLRPQEVTIAEVLQKAGYATGHFGKWHIGSVREGSPVNPGASGFEEWLSAPNFFDNDPILSRRGKAVKLKGESSIVTADAAIDFIRKANEKSQPFLAVVWFGSPHDPHRASAKHRAMYDDQGKKADFLGEITGIDEAVGKLRNTLRDLEIADNTLFWYCSDNGGLRNLAVTGGRLHKGSVYEGGLRVPAIIEWPARIKKHRVTNFPASTCDIYPTLLDLLEIKVPNQPPLDGASLTKVIDGDEPKRATPIGFWDYPAGGVSTPSDAWMRELLAAQQQGEKAGNRERLRLDAGKITQKYSTDSFPGHSAWLAWPWKLHRIEGKKGKAARFELYDLSTDANEAQDLAKKQPERAAQMRGELESWLTAVVNSLNGEDYAADKP